MVDQKGMEMAMPAEGSFKWGQLLKRRVGSPPVPVPVGICARVGAWATSRWALRWWWGVGH